MSLSTYLRFLVGWREATERTAGARGGLDLGLLCVIVSGLAGAFERVDLSYETWRVLSPLGVSLVATTGLYALVALLAWGRGLPVTWRRRSVRSLLVCYWLTEPIFWIQALPLDRFLSPVAAVDGHAWLVAATMAWRVLLLARCVSLLFRFRIWEALCPVMVVANTVLLARLHWADVPSAELAATVRQFVEARRELEICLGAGLAASLFLPAWLIGAVVTVWTGRKLKRPVKWLAAPRQWAKERVARHMFRLVGLALVGWIALLMAVQPSQFRATQIERLIVAGQIDAALAQLSTIDRDDLPRRWEPPPRIGRGEDSPRLGDILRRARREGVSPWVRRVYGEKYAFHYQSPTEQVWEGGGRWCVEDWAPIWLRRWIGRGAAAGLESSRAAMTPADARASTFDLLKLDDDQLASELEVLEWLTAGPAVAASYVPRIDAILSSGAAMNDSRRGELLRRIRDLGIAADR